MKNSKSNVVTYTLQDLLPIGLTFVVTGVVLAFGVQVNSEIRNDMGVLGCAEHTDGKTIFNSTSQLCHNSTGQTSIVGTSSYNSSSDSIGAVTELTSRMDTLALVTIAAVIIGVLLTAFAFRS